MATDLREVGNLWELIERRAEASPDALFALDEAAQQLTFAGYRDASLRAAAGLHALGIAAETVVSWQLPTRLEAMVLVGALARLGAVQNPILPFLREREVTFIARQTRAQHLFVPGVFRGFDHEAMARKVAEAAPGLRVHCCDGALPEGDPATLPLAPLAAAAETAPVRWIFFSSGTTADPKGARHTDHSLAGPGRAMVTVLELTPADRSALVFPFTHVGGINWLFAGLMAGFSQLVVESFHPEASIDWLAAQGVTCAGAGTVFHQAYLAAQRASDSPIFPEIRSFPGGGAPKPPQLYHELKAATGAPIVSGYGLTEHPIAVMGSLRDPDDQLANSEGRATAGTEIRIVKSDGSAAAAQEEGEVRVRGPHLFRGYLDPELEAAAFDDRGYFRTGDLGRMDAAGYLTITGRLKDIIIRKGENVSAKEVEDHLYEHPAIADVAVIGLPDEARGERVCAVAVPHPTQPRPDLPALSAFLRDRGLALQKVPEQLEWLPELPRNPSGKVLKRSLQDRLRGDVP
jgi:acyl-CoA synthetase (AMP-forming)/AMP-acid ligase II